MRSAGAVAVRSDSSPRQTANHRPGSPGGRIGSTGPGVTPYKAISATHQISTGGLSVTLLPVNIAEMMPPPSTTSARTTKAMCIRTMAIRV